MAAGPAGSAVPAAYIQVMRLYSTSAEGSVQNSCTFDSSRPVKPGTRQDRSGIMPALSESCPYTWVSHFRPAMCPSRTDAGIRTACPSGETANNPRPAANLPIQTLKRAAAVGMSPAHRGKCMVRQDFTAPGLHYGLRFVQPQRLGPVHHPGGFVAGGPFALPGGMAEASALRLRFASRRGIGTLR